MHILQINAVYGMRSTGRTVKELDNYLKKNGHKSTIAFSEGETIKNGYKIGSSLEKKIHALMSRITGLQGYFSKKGTENLLNFINNQNPDIVHIRNLHSNFINMPMLFNYLATKDIATVVTLHDCWFFTGGHTHYIKNGYYGWKNGFDKTNRNKNYLSNKSWFFDTSEKIFNDQVKWFSSISKLAFVGVSDWVTKEAKKSQVTDGALVKKIYNWIDTNLFNPMYNNELQKKLNLTNNFIILGVASRWDTNKGFDKFIELSRHIENNMRIVLVGEVDDTSILPNNIIYIPETDNISELVEYYSMADVFLNLSIEETFGKVVVEALSSGTPVITINSTANAELIGPGCGYIIEEWDVFNALKKINLIQKKGRQSFSETCRKFAKENFNPQDKLNQYLELYQELLS